MALKLKHTLCRLEAGTDEAGRGCLSDPFVAASVILPEDFSHPLLNDSKKLTEKQREILRPIIEEKAISFGVGVVNEKEIDKINILQASILAMHKSIDVLEKVPEFISVDGNKFNPYKKIPHENIVKGDGKYLNIAAASVLAKTYRDDIMTELDTEFPMYNWKKNKGYPTKEHRNGIAVNGSCKYHRRTFRLLPKEES